MSNVLCRSQSLRGWRGRGAAPPGRPPLPTPGETRHQTGRQDAPNHRGDPHLAGGVR